MSAIQRRTGSLAIAAIAALVLVTGAACHRAEERAAADTPPRTTAIATTPARTAPAVAAYSMGAIGYAVSSPQCGSELPQPPFAFAIIGITGGWAFTQNPCLADEYEWARRGSAPVSVYMNTNYNPAAYPDVEREIKRSCGESATCQAYLYGAAAARNAYDYATMQGVDARTWWLDVQIASSWSDDTALNALVIKGAVDFLDAHHIRVGISSTPFQWSAVTGDASLGLPGWVAGASDPAQAAVYCDGNQDFGGGRTEQIAYVAGGFEMVRACGPAEQTATDRARPGD